MKKLFIFWAIILSTSSAYATTLGKVESVIGRATRIDLQNKKPVVVTKGSDILHETSYLTNAKGILTLKLFDNSFVRLSHDTKLLVTFEKDQKKWVLYLITGNAKFFFNKNADAQTMLVKTFNGEVKAQSAKFMISYNSILHITSVMSEKGEVEFYSKKEPDEVETIEENEYSYLENDMDEPEDAEELDEKHLQKFKETFEVKKKSK